MLTTYLQYAIGGLAMGSIYALIAVGYAMVWQAIGRLNFAQGPAVMFSGFIGLTVYRLLPPMPNFLAFLLVILLASLLSSLMALFVHKAVHEPILRKNTKIASFERVNLLVGTLSVGIILENVAKMIWTGEPQHFPKLIGEGTIRVSGVSFPALYIWMFLLSLFLVILLQLFFYYTKPGKSLRAVAQDKEAAALMGVNVAKSIQQTFMIVYALGEVAGVMVAPILYAYFANGMPLGLKGFSAAALGGMYNVPGAVLGGILLGVLEGIGAGIVGSGYRNAVAFGILIIVLIFRPTGIFAERKVDKL
jgi:branched-chain amino acid transport system permease protein